MTHTHVYSRLNARLKICECGRLVTIKPRKPVPPGEAKIEEVMSLFGLTRKQVHRMKWEGRIYGSGPGLYEIASIEKCLNGEGRTPHRRSPPQTQRTHRSERRSTQL